ELARPGLFVLQLVSCDEPGSSRGSKVLGLSWAETDFHLAYLNVSCTPIVHYGVARGVGLGFRFGYGYPASPDYARNLQLAVGSLCVSRIGYILIGTIDHVGVGVVERRELVPFWRYRKASSNSGGLDMVFECIEIS